MTDDPFAFGGIVLMVLLMFGMVLVHLGWVG